MNAPDFGSAGTQTATKPPPMRSQRSDEALLMLYHARAEAEDVGRDPWEFAEEIRSLRRHGLSNADLRWLVLNGMLEHGREVNGDDEGSRQFERDDGISFSSKTCFVLTGQGVWYVSRFLDGPESESTLAPQTPTWDGQSRELRVGVILVKRFKVPALNQQTVLSAFEEEEWPASISDPLPVVDGIVPKVRLHDTINSLNRNQKRKLLHFRGSSCGEGIRWERTSACNVSR